MSALKKNSRKLYLYGQDGFTLVELTVVLALITIISFVALPRIQNDVFSDQTKKASRWLLTSVHHLKAASARDKTDYALHVDIDNGRFWASPASVPTAEQEPSPKKGLNLSDGYRIIDVELAGNRKLTTGTVMIQFYAKGYSDQAIIHLRDDDDQEWSYQIPPFLPHLKIIPGYMDLEG